MNKFAIFTLFLVAAGCSDVNEPICTPLKVTISDALPIQFWPADCKTFNQKEVNGVHHKCWCHPWICDDELSLQFSEIGYNNSFGLSAVSDSGEELFYLDFNKQNIYSSNVVLSLPNNDFASSLSGWSQFSDTPGSAKGFVWDAAGAKAEGVSGTSATYQLYAARENAPVDESFNYFPPGYYKILVVLSNNSTGGSSPLSEMLQVKAVNAFPGSGESALVETSRGGGFTEYEVGITLNQPRSYFSFSLYKTGPSSGSIVNVTIQSISIVEYPKDYSTSVFSLSFVPSDHEICNERIALRIVNGASHDDILYNSDCIDVNQYIGSTNLIEYSNNRDIFGLVYSDVSPEQTFQIRVPAIFFHEQFEEEDEVVVLSSSIEKTSGTLQTKRLFETDYLPYYMHKKLQLIFKHQTVIIDGLNWIKKDAYQIVEGDRRWPVKKGKVYLTSRDDVQRAVL